MTEKEIEMAKSLVFEIYAAGFEAGYSQAVDIVTAFNQFFDELVVALNEIHKKETP